jgi:hypothetical protein
MLILFLPWKIPMPGKVFIPFIYRKLGLLFRFPADSRGIPRFLEEKDKFVIYFDNSISWIRVRTHNRGAPCCITGCYFLPYNGAHIIETDGFTELDNFSSDGDDFISAIIDGSGELVSDINAYTTSVMKDPMAFFPYKIKVVDVFFICIVKSNLLGVIVVLELPVRWRCNDKMYGMIWNFHHGSGIANDDFLMTVFHYVNPLIFIIEQ